MFLFNTDLTFSFVQSSERKVTREIREAFAPLVVNPVNIVRNFQSEIASVSVKMHFVKLFLIFCTLTVIQCQEALNGDSPPRPGQASLVIIFDTTSSMGDDLEELRAGAAFIIRKMMNKVNNPIYNYIFVPFNDPCK